MRTPTFTYDKYANDGFGGFSPPIIFKEPDGRLISTRPFGMNNPERWFICIKDFQQPRPPSSIFPDWSEPHFQEGDLAYISPNTTGAGPDPFPPSGRPDLPPGFYTTVWFEDAYHRRKIKTQENFDRRIDALSRLDCTIHGIDPDYRVRYKKRERDPDPNVLQAGVCTAAGDAYIHQSFMPEFFEPYTQLKK